jgi:hypothetical protein
MQVLDLSTANDKILADIRRYASPSAMLGLTHMKKAFSKAGAKTSSSRRTASTPASTDWRSELLARLRTLIKQADPEMGEEVKWRKPSNPAGVPVWSHGGIVCTGEKYRDKVKLTFAYGASLPDPSRLFNSSLDAGTRRAIDFPESAKINERAFKSLIRAAAALNMSKAPKKKSAKKK